MSMNIQTLSGSDQGRLAEKGRVIQVKVWRRWRRKTYILPLRVVRGAAGTPGLEWSQPGWDTVQNALGSGLCQALWGCVLMNFALTQKWHGKPPEVLGREMVWPDLYFNWISPAAFFRLDCRWANSETGRPVKWLLLIPEHEVWSAVEVMKSGCSRIYCQGLAGSIRCRIWEMKWRPEGCPGFWLEALQSWSCYEERWGRPREEQHGHHATQFEMRWVFRCLFPVHMEMSQVVGNMSLECSREIPDRDLEVVQVTDTI